jgi:hypothetical protein
MTCLEKSKDAHTTDEEGKNSSDRWQWFCRLPSSGSLEVSMVSTYNKMVETAQQVASLLDRVVSQEA